MAFTAIDANFSLAPYVTKLVTGGVQLVGRYLSHTPSKNLTRAEALAFGNRGIGCWMVWETTQGRGLEGKDARTADVADGIEQAAAIGAPRGAGIYFAVDSDVSTCKLQGR
jgi:hypothetical protein